MPDITAADLADDCLDVLDRHPTTAATLDALHSYDRRELRDALAAVLVEKACPTCKSNEDEAASARVDRDEALGLVRDLLSTAERMAEIPEESDDYAHAGWALGYLAHVIEGAKAATEGKG